MSFKTSRSDAARVILSVSRNRVLVKPPRLHLICSRELTRICRCLRWVGLESTLTQAICLAPSRELARQIHEVVSEIGKFTSVTAFLAIPNSWSRNVKLDKHIIIGTPGTLIDMLSRNGRVLPTDKIRVFVLDEADELVNLQGMGDQTRRIQRTLPRGTQNVLFSATFSDEVRAFANSVAPEANQLYLRSEEVTVDAIKQLYLECDGEDQKYEALSMLYDVMSIGQSIVFCQVSKVDRIS